jgi:fatty acid desaturase
LRRCPNCGADMDAAPLPDLPPLVEGSEELQGPAFPQSQRRSDDTAPLSEFIAAGVVLLGAVLLVVAAIVGSGTLALVSVIVMFGVTGFFAIFKGSMGRALQHYRATMWSGRHPDEAATRDRNKRRE